MKRQIFTLAATALAILPLGVNAAQNNFNNNQNSTLLMSENQMAQNRSGGKRDKGARMERILQQLDLTSQQSEQIETIREEFTTENEALYEEIKSNREQMQSLFSNDTSSAQLRQQHQQTQALRQNLSNNRFEMMVQIREILTPEQREQIALIMSERRDRMNRR